MLYTWKGNNITLRNLTEREVNILLRVYGGHKAIQRG